MDILKILKESYQDLLPEDFEFFETELDTGNYDAAYAAECRKQMEVIKNAVSEPGRNSEPEEPQLAPAENTPPGAKAEEKPIGSPELEISLTPGGMETKPRETPQLTVAREIGVMRRNRSYLPEFKKYIREHSDIFTPEYVDEHFSFFFPPEIDSLIMNIQMGEPFLEKYFGALDHDKIARYQLFSEAFFIKHYSQLNASVVLEHGKNEWRKKEKRSKQLDVFLRLKGIKN